MNQTNLSNQQYEKISDQATIKKVAAALQARNITPIIVDTKEEALEKIKELIPDQASVNNGASVTLEQIGFVDYLKSDKHPWNNVKSAVVAEKDPIKQNTLRKQAILADYFLGSVHAITEDGELVIASNTGSQLPSYAFSSEHVIWVAGTQKIVVSLDDAFTRLRTYVFPLEDKHMKDLGMGGSSLNKILIFEREPAFLNRKLYMILVNEKLGF